MRYPRAEALTSPAVIGERYSVRCAHATLGAVSGWWPILGELHADPDITTKIGRHLHIDWRFPGAARVERTLRAWTFDDALWRLTFLTLHKGPGLPMAFRHELPRKTGIRRIVKICRRPFPVFGEDEQEELGEKFETWAATQRHLCLDLSTMICPHKGIPLGGVPVVDGVITCPGHGLSFCATTGKRAELPS